MEHKPRLKYAIEDAKETYRIAQKLTDFMKVANDNLCKKVLYIMKWHKYPEEEFPPTGRILVRHIYKDEIQYGIVDTGSYCWFLDMDGVVELQLPHKEYRITHWMEISEPDNVEKLEACGNPKETPRENI